MPIAGQVPSAPWADGESGGGQRAASCVGPPLLLSSRIVLLLAQVVHPLADGIELLLEPLGFVPEHFNLLLSGRGRIRCAGHKGRSNTRARPAGQTGGVVLVPPPPSTAAATEEPTAWPWVCPTGRIVPCTVAASPSSHGTHATRSASVSSWHSDHLPSI